MLALKIIFGIFLIFGAASVLAFPAIGSVAICWMISFFMLVAGVIAIIRFIEGKNAEKVAKKNGIPYIKTGVGSLVFGIAAIVTSILSRSSLIGELVFIRVISVMFGAWIIFNGISMIVSGTLLKKGAIPGWLPMIILGVLIILAGIFCVVDTFMGLTSIGVAFGISMMFTGFAYLLG